MVLVAATTNRTEFVVTYFNIGTLMTVPVYIWGLVRKGIDPSLNAVDTITLLTLVGLVVLSGVLSRRRA